MTYFLTILALAATLAAALGETTRKTGGRKRLTWVGVVVVSAAVLTAVVSIVVGVFNHLERLDEEHARARLRSIWTTELRGVVNTARGLNDYLVQNARLEAEKGPNPHKIYDKGKRLRPPPRPEFLVLGLGTARLSRDEEVGLLGKFSVNPPRYPWRAWPAGVSWRRRSALTLDERISRIADGILGSLERISKEFGASMDPGERANVEELRRSSYLVHLASIRDTAADARLREDSFSYPVSILQPGISGAAIADFDKFVELLDAITEGRDPDDVRLSRGGN